MITYDHKLISLIRVGNLILASLYILGSLMNAAHYGWHFSNRAIFLDSIDLVWFFGALGLFFRWRVAWIGSLVGTGAWTYLWGAFLVEGIRRDSLSAAEQLRQQDGLVVFIFAVVMTICFFLILFLASFGLFVGLVRMRKDLALT